MFLRSELVIEGQKLHTNKLIIHNFIYIDFYATKLGIHVSKVMKEPMFKILRIRDSLCAFNTISKITNLIFIMLEWTKANM